MDVIYFIVALLACIGVAVLVAVTRELMLRVEDLEMEVYRRRFRDRPYRD